MKMNFQLSTLTLLTLLTCSLFHPPTCSAAEPVPAGQLFQAREFQLDLNGFTRTADVKSFDYGAGFGVNYFPWRSAGFGLDFQAEDTASAFFDRIGVAFIGRMPLEKLRLAPEFKVGYDYDFERGDNTRTVFDEELGDFRTIKIGDGNGHEVFASVGAELRLTKHVGFGVEARGVKPLNGSSEYLLGIARLRFTF